jgi:hypothetical protein
METDVGKWPSEQIALVVSDFDVARGTLTLFLVFRIRIAGGDGRWHETQGFVIESPIAPVTPPSVGT